MAPVSRAGRRRKGRPRRIAARTCVACRETGDKRALVRLVRTPLGVLVDPTGRQAGRGAYLHRSADCWERALADIEHILRHALKTEITSDDVARLREFADTIAAADEGGE
ncbi:MAG: YlxR family protein [Anaerolineales bacterium]